MLQQDKLSKDNVYQLLLGFDQVYAAASEVERKDLMRAFIDRIELFPEKRQDGCWIKNIVFNFPIPVSGQDVVDLSSLESGGIVETVVLLSKGEIDSRNIQVELSLEDMDLSGFRSNVTYNQIKEWVKEQTGLSVSSLYIAQVKRKYGLTVGLNQNPATAEGGRVPQCPPEKEAAIKAALEHFRLLPATRTEDA